jgi:hypothetical protein
MELVESNGGLSSVTCDGRNHVHVGHVPFNVIAGRRDRGHSGYFFKSGGIGAAGSGSFWVLFQKPELQMHRTALSLLTLFVIIGTANDGSNHVIVETINGGAQTFLYSYAQSGNANGYNHWKFKTTETRPDESENIVYCNYAGQAMLRVLQSSGSQWCDYYQYDNATGDLLVHARPSGVAGFSESYADLLVGCVRGLALKQAYILRIFVPAGDFRRGRTVPGQSARTAAEELFGVVHGGGPFLRWSL